MGDRQSKRRLPPFKTTGARPIDKGIARAVRLLWENGVETFESCEGGPGHSFPEPTIRFFGGQAEGFRALSVALVHKLPVADLRRYWNIQDGEAIGPNWELTFSPAIVQRG